VTDASAHGKANHGAKDDGGSGNPVADQGALDEDVIATQQLGGGRAGFAGHDHNGGGGCGSNHDGFTGHDRYGSAGGGDFDGAAGDDHFCGGYGGGARFNGGYGGSAHFGGGRGGGDRHGGAREGSYFGHFHHYDGVSH
jgi:hypothetical protein